MNRTIKCCILIAITVILLAGCVKKPNQVTTEPQSIPEITTTVYTDPSSETSATETNEVPTSETENSETGGAETEDTEEIYDPEETFEDEHTETVGEGQGIGSL